MEKMQKIAFTILLFFCSSAELFSEDYRDSLFTVLETTKFDTAKVDTYNELVWEFYGVNNDSALFFAKKAIDLATVINYKKGLSNAHRYAGLIYERLSNYPRALFHQQKSLKLSQELNFKPGIANTLNNIGIIYEHLSDYKKALEYQERSLALCIELDQKEGIAAVYGNMGNIYNSIHAMEKSLEYYQKSLAIYEELENPYGIAVSLGNIGNIYFSKKDYPKALEYQLKGLELRRQTGNTQGEAIALSGIGDIYLATGKIAQAKDYYKKSLHYAKETGALSTQRDANYGLYQVYKKTGEYKDALRFHEAFVQLKDSVFSSERNEEIANIKTQYALEKQQSELEQKSKEEKLRFHTLAEAERMRIQTKADADHQRQQIIIYFSIAGLILVALFSGFLYNRFSLTKKQKNIIELQKSIVEEKNKQITDSINYAQRIQNAVLPGDEDFRKALPESFILFLPKDIVSGDFYWVNDTKEKDVVIYATADCTGHGVPGGFMSMLGTSFLNEIVNENGVTEPGTILTILREKIIHSLRQNEKESESRDGMDIVLCKLDKRNKVLSYATANNHFYVWSEGSLIKLFGDKMPIGYHTGEEESFRTKNHHLKNGDVIFTFTDGYADQFGGKHNDKGGKKFKYNRFEPLLTNSVNSTMDHTYNALKSTFENWKGDHEQVDDVCVIGVRIV